MAMDFFEHQDSARRQTRRLVVLFVLAVICIFVLTYVAVVLFVTGFEAYQTTDPVAFTWRSMLRPELLLTVGAGVLLVVGGGTAYKLSSLSAGGSAVAELLGGQLVDPSDADPTHRKVLNVVEEMAIASGVPVPPVYIMQNEAGINAFAAGYSPSDAVVGVTRGCAELLSREELQGVIAHEFSHILNGDMRLNIRLMGMVHGILVIGLAGWMLIRVALIGGGRHRRRNSKDNPMPLALLGLALLVIGFTGVLFANLIKAAVSRQREFLADAAAVQFTRNPGGIAGALRKIGGFAHGSNIGNERAAEASHMFFGQALSSGLTSLFATHPPLTERVRRLEPDFTGKFEQITPEPAVVEQPRQQQPRPARAAAGMSMGLAGESAIGRTQVAAAASAGAQSAGQVTAQHLAYARQLIERVPPALQQAIHETFGARAVIYALLLDRDDKIRQRQLQRLEAHADPAVHQLTQRLAGEAGRLDPALRLIVIDMALPALREMSPRQYQAFNENIEALIEADQQLDLMEWALRRIVQHHLAANYGNAKVPAVRYHRLQPVAQSCALLLSVLVYVGHRDMDAAQHAFGQAATHLELPGLQLLPVDQCDLRKLDGAIDQLVQASMREKRKVLNASAVAISADAKVTPREAELFRAMADALHCPVPPLLPGQPLA